jgi:hypothetical protein
VKASATEAELMFEKLCGPADNIVALTQPKCARNASKTGVVASLEMRAYGAPA